MKRSLKLGMFYLASGAVALHLGGCGGGGGSRWILQLLGDLTADTLFLRGVD